MRIKSDAPFITCLGLLSGLYIVLILLLVFADVAYMFVAPDADNIAVLSRSIGIVEIAPEGTGRRLSVRDPATGQADEYTIGPDKRLYVEDGDTVKKGDLLTNGEMTGMQAMYRTLSSPEIRYAIMLSLVSCTISTILSLWVAIPIGYMMSRYHFRGKAVIDTILDIPIVLPPLVVGISLLVLFNFPPFSWLSAYVVYEVPAVIMAQFMVAAAFAVRTMRVTFDRIPQRYENVALTLGCNRSKAFWRVIMPQARYGVLAAATLAWARALGEFGPILVFAGSTRMRTEVLPTSVFLELQAGSLKGMLAISLLMIVTAAIVLVTARLFGMKKGDI
jgi:molybdate transport system permease protein